jgi:hypothetical protein
MRRRGADGVGDVSAGRRHTSRVTALAILWTGVAVVTTTTAMASTTTKRGAARPAAAMTTIAGESAGRATDGGARFSLLTEVSCDPLPGPGKVQCLVRVRPVGGVLKWSDAIVVAAPSFAPPLRTRVAAGDAKRSDPDGVEFSLALAATGDGVGELRVLARGAVCGDGGCRPVQAEGSARVAVGATGNAALAR